MSYRSRTPEVIVKAEGGIGFFGLLQIVFIVLKLTNVIKWAWGLVLLPIIVYAAIVVLLLIAIGVLLLLARG